MNRRDVLRALFTGGAIAATGAVILPAAKIFLPPRGGWPVRNLSFRWQNDPRYPILARGWTFDAEPLHLHYRSPGFPVDIEYPRPGYVVVVDDSEGFDTFHAAGGRWMTL